MSRKAQIVGSVVAGFPSPAEQYLEPPLDLNELLVKRPAATFFVRVQGDSMVGAGIRDNDLLVVDRSLTPANGDIIIAAVDGEFTVKRLGIGDSGLGIGDSGLGIGDSGLGIGKRRKVYRLMPENPKFKEMVIQPGQEFAFWGVVTACIHRFKGELK